MTCLSVQLAAAMLGAKGYNELKVRLILNSMEDCCEKLRQKLYPTMLIELFEKVMDAVEAAGLLPLEKLTSIKGLTEQIAQMLSDEDILGEMEPECEDTEQVAHDREIWELKLRSMTADEREVAIAEKEEDERRAQEQKLEAVLGQLQEARRKEMYIRVELIDQLAIEVMGEPKLIEIQMKQMAVALKEEYEPKLRAKTPNDVCEFVLMLADVFGSGRPQEVMSANRVGIISKLTAWRESLYGEWPKVVQDDWDPLTTLGLIDDFGVAILGEWAVSESKVAALSHGVRFECAGALERNKMDDYAMDLLVELQMALDKDGDGSIDAEEVVQVGI